MDPRHRRPERTLDIRRAVKRCPTCGQRFCAEAAFCPFDGTKLESARVGPAAATRSSARSIDGRYEVDRASSARAAWGSVYEVRHIALDRRFAHEGAPARPRGDAELAARFIQEAKATASVQHPNIVADHRLRRARPTAMPLLRDGAPRRRRRSAQVIKTGGPIPAGARGAHRPPGRRRARRGARGGHRPSRSQARQRLPRRRHRPAGRVRATTCGSSTSAPRRSSAPSRVTQGGHRLRDAALHVPGAGERPARRPPRGHLRARRHHVRDVHRPRAVRGRHVHGRAHAAHVRAARPPSQVSPRGARARRARGRSPCACLAKKPEERYASMDDARRPPSTRVVPFAQRRRRCGSRRASSGGRAGPRAACASRWPTSWSRRRSRRCASPIDERAAAAGGRMPGLRAWVIVRRRRLAGGLVRVALVVDRAAHEPLAAARPRPSRMPPAPLRLAPAAVAARSAAPARRAARPAPSRPRRAARPRPRRPPVAAGVARPRRRSGDLDAIATRPRLRRATDARGDPRVDPGAKCVRA